MAKDILLVVGAIYLTGVWVTAGLFAWAADQPGGEVSVGRMLWASALWIATLPIAAVVINRLRHALPYALAVRRGAVPFAVSVVVTSPDERTWDDACRILKRSRKGRDHG